MAQTTVKNFMEKYFGNDDGRFDPNDHIEKFSMIFLAVIFVTCILLRTLGVI